MPRRRLTPESRRFGLELEFSYEVAPSYVYSARRDLFHHLRETASEYQIPYRQQLSYHRTLSTLGRWDLKVDGSCGYELASPPLRWDTWWQVGPLCTAIRESGGRVNRSCGVHVHHEIPEASGNQMLRRLFLLWYALEPLAFASVAPSRWDNVYCHRINRGMYPQRADALLRIRGNRQVRQEARDLGRHASLNFLSYWRNGTAEFRMHHGSLDPVPLEWWVTFTQTIVQVSARALRNPTFRALLLDDPVTLPERFTHLVHRLNLNSDRVTTMLRDLPAKSRTNPTVLDRFRGMQAELTRTTTGAAPTYL